MEYGSLHQHPARLPLRARYVRFAIGCAVLAAVAGFFASGYAPPGPAGEVLRHNRKRGIDASPLFYTEVEHMQELEAGLATTIAEEEGADPLGSEAAQDE